MAILSITEQRVIAYKITTNQKQDHSDFLLKDTKMSGFYLEV